jgi:hypothetical protein
MSTNISDYKKCVRSIERLNSTIGAVNSYIIGFAHAKSGCNLSEIVDIVNHIMNCLASGQITKNQRH